MRVIISSLMSSFVYLLDVGTVLLLCLLIFGILGVQLYGGTFKYRCFDLTTGTLFPTNDQNAQLYQICSLQDTTNALPSYCHQQFGNQTNQTFCGKDMNNPAQGSYYLCLPHHRL